LERKEGERVSLRWGVTASTPLSTTISPPLRSLASEKGKEGKSGKEGKIIKGGKKKKRGQGEIRPALLFLLLLTTTAYTFGKEWEGKRGRKKDVSKKKEKKTVCRYCVRSAVWKGKRFVSSEVAPKGGGGRGKKKISKKKKKRGRKATHNTPDLVLPCRSFTVIGPGNPWGQKREKEKKKPGKKKGGGKRSCTLLRPSGLLSSNMWICA